jgi:transcriptional regulator with XRE-family HTH domain
MSTARQRIATMIGRNIAYHRNRLCWSGKVLAAKIGINNSRLNRWELGHVPVPAPDLVLIAATLGVKVTELLPADPS